MSMNRAYPQVTAALQPYDVPVLQIDQPMMERAVDQGGKVLVVATHGPTVNNTQALLRETAARLGREPSFSGTTVEAAWECLAAGDVYGHNRAVAQAIHAHLDQEPASCVVLAQLSMACFLFSYPDPLVEFGIPVYTSAQCGFEKARELLMARRMSMYSGGNHAMPQAKPGNRITHLNGMMRKRCSITFRKITRN